MSNIIIPFRANLAGVTEDLTSFKMTIDTTKPGSASDTFVLGLSALSSVNMIVYWGDGTSDLITTYNQSELTHSYGVGNEGVYQLTLSGSFDGLYFFTNDTEKLISIDQWGTNKWKTGSASFRNCINMVGNYTDNPDFSEITTMGEMFFGCINFDGALNFDIPLCTTLAQTFVNCDSLNSNITFTNSSNVLTTFQMFANCDIFNGNVSISDTSNVTTMDRMFERCSAFNQPINFDTSSVNNMFRMFSRCTNFNQPVNFNTINVLSMYGMFEVCPNFNSAITFSDTSNVTTMLSMFTNSTNFNQPLNFDTSSVNNMQSMFQNCTNFNQPVNFNTSNVNTMLAMFQGCPNFNQPVNFDTSSVTSMERMFYLCSSFNQIINFSTSSLTNTYRMMRNCVAFNSSFTLSDTSAVTTMQEMFFNAINFNEDISSFNISSLTNATSMLQSSAFDVTNYDLLLPAWDAYGTSGVTFHAGTAQYNCPIPSEAKANMLSRGWTITDGGIIPCSEFKMTIDTTQAGSSSNTFVLQLQDELTTFIVNWGDGNSDTITAWNQAELTHVYSVGGTYQISLDGFFGGFLYQTGDKLKISSIDQWGTNAFSKMNYAFNGCANMVLNATDEPDLLGCTNLDNMFSGCTSLNTEINWSSTSNVTNFLSFLQGCTAFNSNVTLNTDSALNFQQMFFGNTIFNSNVTFSDTSNVGSFLQMFMSCPVFNKPLTFDCSSLTTTYRMFLFCTNFNSALNFTNTSNLSNAFQMLYATSFDQDISTWDITSLTNGTGMLQNSAFSQTNYDLLLPAWDAYGTSNVPFHAGPAQYAAAPSAPATAHANMLGRGWTITDGGPI